MQPSPLSRANSHATSGGRTLVGSDNGAYFPWDGTGSPIIQTPDQKQWIDLELLNPKFLKGLSQYAPSLKDEPESKLGKGAAKIKAWARQSKAGIEIRLRRKINSEKDEITDIRLVPDAYPPDFKSGAEMPPVLQELPAMRSFVELADTTSAMELDATHSGQPSGSIAGSAIGEPLPRYERDVGTSSADATSAVLDPLSPPPVFPDQSVGVTARDLSLVRPAEFRHRPSLSQSSIIATPTRGLSLRGAPTASSPSGSDAKAGVDGEATVLQANLDDANKKLEEERHFSESLQAIIQALSEEQPQQQILSSPLSEGAVGKKAKRPQVNRLRVADRTTYETETDLEPTSPPANARRKETVPASRRKSLAFAKQKLPATSTKDSRNLVSDSSDEEPTAASIPLMRKQTLPKRVPATAGINIVWRSLIRMQTILLGPDHRLTIQAKSDLQANRVGHSAEQSANLDALESSRALAERDFGSDHPWVAAFTEDLQKLIDLLKSRQAPVVTGTPPRGVQSGHKKMAERCDRKRAHASGGSTLQPPELTTTKDADPVAGASLHSIDTSVQSPTPEKQPSPVVGGVEIDSRLDVIWNTGGSPHQPGSSHITFIRLGLAALSSVAWGGIDWLQRNYGPEQPVAAGKTRVRWTCSCGQKLHDDFIERRPGAARALEAYLNRPTGSSLGPRHAGHAQTLAPNNGSSPTTADSSPGRRSFGSSFGAPASSHTSYSNYSFHPGGSWPGGDDSKMQQTWMSMPSQLPFSPTYEPPWLLTCATEDRFTPKVTHLDMSPQKIHSDKDLANSLREHYFNVNKKWWKSLRLRGLTTIEFVQFEVHQNRFADIRKVPDVPLQGRPDYNFEPSDLLPPVGSQYLLHLFKHPEDYDGELITYLRAPKKNGRLQLGVGWGINLVEGFLAHKVWIWMSTMFALGSMVFGITYAVKLHDVQGAFGVAAWMVTLGALAVGWLQACLG